MISNAKKLVTVLKRGGGLGPEILTDWDMEAAGVTSWPAYSSPTTREKSVAEAYDGSQSLHIVSGGGAMGAQQVYNLVTGKTYRVSAWVKCVTGTGTVYSNIGNAGQVAVGSTAATVWTEITADILCGLGSARSILLLFDGSNEGFFDNVSVRKL